jgi:hypothetical protein
MNHYQRGHTFEYFSFSNANINRAAYTSMWPLGTGPGVIQGEINARHNVPPAPTDSRDAAWAPGVTTGHTINNRAVGFLFTNGQDYWSGPPHNIRIYPVDLNQFFPDPAPDNLTLPRQVLAAIKALLHK